MTTKKQINLISSEMTVSAKTIALSKTLNKISIFGAVLLIILIMAVISGIVYYNIEYKKVSSSINVLKEKIVKLEKSEQKLILIKDKLSKIAIIKKIDSVDDELSSFQNFQSLITDSSVSAITEVSITPQKTETSLLINNSDSLFNIFKKIITLPKYNKIVLSSLGFTSTGYLVSLVFEN